MKNYKNSVTIQIRYNDIDIAGHVNNAVQLFYYDQGRLYYFNEVFKNTILWNEKGFVVVKSILNYSKPIYLNDQIFVRTKVIKLGTKSLGMLQEIINQNNEICSTNESVLVGFDYINQVSIEIPLNWKSLILEFEGEVDSK